MKAFHTIAIPHKDILEGRLTLDVFGADLWEVSLGRGPDEYKDTDTFFRKTYMTQGLEALLGVVERRVKGNGGDPVIQIQTPFGGGKTHSMIAMYHMANKWGIKKVVVSGTSLGPEQTLWGFMEKSLTGNIKRCAAPVSPGKETIRSLLEENQPVLLLMDEVLAYATRAAGVRVEKTTLADQTVLFIQELCEAVSTLEKACLVITLPASVTEHYGEAAERIFQQLQKVAGRLEKIYVPVQENEIAKIIRRRLFSSIDENAAKETVSMFMEYAEREGLLPAGIEPSEYRGRFIDSYPLMPEVIDVLYHRWGSFPTFQRTRGVLRLLALVIHSLKTSDKPYISLADFDLKNQEIRQELLKHTGPAFNGIIAADITDTGAGAKGIDGSLSRSYQGLNLGTRTATTIFMYSFSGAEDQGATMAEIRRSATTMNNPASAVGEVINECADPSYGKLFYLHNRAGKYFFSTKPNLNRIRLTKMENIKEDEIIEEERSLLREGINSSRLRVFLWEDDPSDIPDNEELKLVILREENKELMESIVKKKGQGPRVYGNTIFFLVPMESEKQGFKDAILHKIADERIEADPSINLSDDQRKEIKTNLRKADSNLKEYIRRLYRKIFIPYRDAFKEGNLGVPTYGEHRGLAQEVYEHLRSSGEIMERVAPLVIKEKYLAKKEYVSTENIYQSLLKTPGEPRPINKSVVEEGIAEGVRIGLFGLGELEDGRPILRGFKEHVHVMLTSNEVILSESICKAQMEKKGETAKEKGGYEKPPEEIELEGKEPDKVSETPMPVMDEVQLRFRVPRGKVANIMGMMNYLQSKFDKLEIELKATDGEISEQEYTDKVEETLDQLGIKVKRDDW